MSNIRTAFLLFFVFVSSFAKAEIYSAESALEINNTILELLSKRNPSKTLLILPLEGFLIAPRDKEFHISDRKYVAALQKAEKKAKLSKKVYLEELILTEYDNELVDPFAVEFIKNIQKNNVPMLVFTSNCSGSINKIPYLEVWTWSFLFDKGIDLSQSPIGSKQFIFNKYHKKIKGTYPTFYKGLLSANSAEGKNSVQSVLASLFAVKLKVLPDVVYVVHKDESFIKSIEQQFQSLRKDIQIEGFVFSPPNVSYNDLSTNQVYLFWTKVIEKLNKVSRTESNKDEEDPYEQ
jgi:hypothetical protein